MEKIHSGKSIHIADLFCGAGGTSTGAMLACRELGYEPQLTAVNHWPQAVETHQANHPDARHFCQSIDNLNPRELFDEGGLDLLWASPECTHHSIARGGRPINDQSRATAWCVVRWAEALRPPVILIENVPEFERWGGVGANGRPLKHKRGETFRAWKAALESLGYRVEHRLLCAADYGDPTTRRRLFIQAVLGRRRIAWPDASHGRVEESAVLSLVKPWRAAREIIDWTLLCPSIYERPKPLSDKTMARIMEGLRRFGSHTFIIPHFGERPTQRPRCHSTKEPLPAVTGQGAGSLVKPFLVELRGTSARQVKGTNRSLEKPLSTVSASGAHHALVQPFLLATNHDGQARLRSTNDPLPTVCGNRGEWALCDAALLPQQSDGRLRPVSEPAPTIATSGAVALVQPFLVKYNGTGGACSIDSPCATVPTKDRFGLVRPVLEIEGERYLLDIGFRMLQPHELAAAQGFPSDYLFTGNKTEVVKQIGNAVPVNLSRALVKAVMRKGVTW